MSKLKKLNMPISHYHIEYVEGKEWDYHIFRGKEDVTKELKNNLVSDMFYPHRQNTTPEIFRRG